MCSEETAPLNRQAVKAKKVNKSGF